MRLIPVALLVFLACAGQPGPKEVVFDFIDAVLTSDSLRVAKHLDVDSYLKTHMPEMSPEDSVVALAEMRGRTIRSLLGDGDVRRRWLASQIIVNEETASDSTAEVEVSFIDRSTNHMVYTRMQLRRQPDGSWRITYFR